MGRRIWVVISDRRDAEGRLMIAAHTYDCRVLSFSGFFAAEGPRKKHLVNLWTDPGGMRTLSVGSIRMKDPNRAAAMRARHERGEFAT